MGAPDPHIDRFMTEVARLCSTDPRLNSLSAAILAGVAFDIAHDSRGFARALGIEHALVLREIQALLDLQRLSVVTRDERTQRCSYAATSSPDLWPAARIGAHRDFTNPCSWPNQQLD